ncbi:uncharacterized protein isoform X3 [Danio rerio]
MSVNLFIPSQGQNIQRAKIFSQNKEVPEGGKLEVKCSAFGLATKAVYIYLCTDGIAVDVQYGQDVFFKIERVEINQSGNYSCVFSEEKLKITKVMGYGQNNIFINVTESLINTYIHVEKSEVLQGSDAEFICSTSSPLNKTQSKNIILAYLIKNEKPVKVNIWNTEEMKTTFTLRDVRMEDAGMYSCAVLLNMLPHHERRFKQNNKVNFQIAAESDRSTSTVIIILTYGMIMLIILLLGLWFLIQKQGCIVGKKRSLRIETELEQTEVIYEVSPKPDTAGTDEIRSIVCAASENDFSDYNNLVLYNE